MAMSDTSPTLTSIVSESMPHLKRGAMRDFLKIMEEHGYYDDASWNKTDYIYTLPNGSKIEFFSADSPDKLRGPRRDRLYLNECNNMPYEAYSQLEVRTKDIIWLDWNPTNEFWFYTEVLPQRPDDVDHIVINYKDNEALDDNIVKSIESRMGNKSWWKVYGEGLLGEVEGKIYRDWQIIDDVPHEARLERRGLDFGYTNDPTTIVDIHYYNGGYILDEVCYQKGMLNNAIADVLKNLSPCVTRADSAEPKSIDELRMYGLTVLPATKGPGSVTAGIQTVQQLRISVTKRSVNIIREYRNYLFEVDRDGKILNVPASGQEDHTMDAIRYGMEGVMTLPKKKSQVVRRTGGDSYTGYGSRRIVRDSIFN